MGVFSLNPLRSRDGRHSRLPVYENLNAPSKERDSNDSYDSSDYDDYSVTSSPSTNNSRHTSSSSAATPMMSKKRFTLAARRPGRSLGNRLPNKVIRYLCIGLVSTILLFMFTLIRASQNENRMISEGKIAKGPLAPPLWESYPFLTRYYGGLRNLVSLQTNVPEYPRPEDELPLDKLAFVNFTEGTSGAYKRDLPASEAFVDHPGSIFKTAPEKINECFVDANNKVRVPPIRYYSGRPNGFPEAVLGSYDLLGFNEDICYERYGRYGPYGLGYSVRTGGLGIGEHGEKDGAESTFKKVPHVDWHGMDWADAQRRCYQANAARYKPLPNRVAPPHGFFIDDKTVNATLLARDILSETTAAEEKATTNPGDKEVAQKLPRTAVVIRCWDEYFFQEEDLMNLRSLITELALASGGRYDVHLLVQVKNDAWYPIWADAATYEQRIRDVIPLELQGLVTFWTETQMLALYQGIYDLYARGPDLPVHGVYRGLAMAMQYFAYQHPEYDYFWQWEMDIRYTGHYYDFFTKVENWAKEQPRKGLWERNARFYLPSVHGTWEDFRQMARVQAEMGVTGADNIWDGVAGKNKLKDASATRGDNVVWGPERPREEQDWFESENDPKPETTYEKDKYIWGVGEEAEYIAFNPMFDPDGTTWGLADDITGYNTTRGQPPRRAQIITASRMSRRLLLTMHRQTAFKKQFAFPEMWPATVALQHGYKAVFVPHPLYVDREWPTEVFARTLNNGKNGASGGSRTSVFGQREHNLRGLTWFYDSGFAPNLYRRWLGMKVNNDGGEEFELTEDKSKNGTTVSEMRGGEGRMCLPPMLLHPIKNVDMPVEEVHDEIKVPESDPAA
ncbi:hypothetical protein BJ170DRAFT_37984 [Xylariales sp. AK1849]|nr:hypothetical protein BJ170DRAFT_37984 [Xylariales sp. AK1849]